MLTPVISHFAEAGHALGKIICRVGLMNCIEFPPTIEFVFLSQTLHLLPILKV